MASESENESESNFYLFFEWVENDLKSVPSSQFRTGHLPKIVAKSVLEALALIQEKFKAIHIDVNPNNIFLSSIREPEPVVKLGDLGNMLVEGYDKIRLQSLETRAPEVWRGLDCWPASDVWSLGVTLAHWLSGTTIFGPKDKMVQGLTEAWCIAKIQRLVGPVEAPINPDYEDEFLITNHLETTTFIHPDTNLETQFIKKGTLREELERLQDPKVPSDLINFIEYVLVVDYRKRPTASEALRHPYLQFTW
ncbi:42af014d-f82e-49a6-9a4e-116853ca4dfa [Sclerotinia trifoliorum]|uniref:42af014d-f82e-49a6-9a4e-116853ca4dfa n=1 Tax=Sclerotinia trifoliorum TaxID=28548 RepID=A0A8H2VNC7_9HELO|nr:42af014d-f82e-49a6-9a4e-116853ca4dfa [Sclerotinia trifoliorum]